MSKRYIDEILDEVLKLGKHKAGSADGVIKKMIHSVNQLEEWSSHMREYCKGGRGFDDISKLSTIRQNWAQQYYKLDNAHRDALEAYKESEEILDKAEKKDKNRDFSHILTRYR